MGLSLLSSKDMNSCKQEATMRFLLGLGLGLLTPLIFRAWRKCHGSKTVHKIQGFDEKNAGDGSVLEASSPASPDRAENMSSDDRPTEFEWPKVKGSSQDSEFHW
jgi:hypothetical protein